MEVARLGWGWRIRKSWGRSQVAARDSMPPDVPKATPLAREIVQGLKELSEDAYRLSILYRIPVSPREGATPIVFTIDVGHDLNGLFFAVCPEMPGMFLAGSSEQEVLLGAEREIRTSLAASWP